MKPECKEKKTESPIHCFLREHIKPIVRFLLSSASVIVFFVMIYLLYSFVCQISFGISSNTIEKAEEFAAAGKLEDLSGFLKGFSGENRSKIEEALLKKAIEEKNREKLAKLFSVASQEGHPIYLRALEPDGQFIIEAMKSGKFNLDFTFPDGTTLLENASLRKDTQAFKALLDAGADPNHVFSNGLFPAFHLFDKPEHFQLLMNAKDCNVYVTDWDGCPLLFKILENEKYDLLPEITRKQKSFTRKNKDGQTYLHILLSGKVSGSRPLLACVLKCPCAINEPGTDGETPLQTVMKNKMYNLCMPMLNAGAKPYETFEEEIEKTRLKDKYLFFKAKNKKRMPVEKSDEEPVVYQNPQNIRPVFPLPDWKGVIIFAVYLASGLLSLRLVKESKSIALDQWRNIPVMLGGFFSLILILVFKFCGKIIERIKKLIDLAVDSIHQDFVRFYTSAGLEYEKINDPEMLSAFIFARNMFDRVIRNNISEFAIVPMNGKYQILFKNGTEEKLFAEMETKACSVLLKLLKAIAGLNVADNIKPQNGAFSVSLNKEEQKRVAISTIGLGTAGERAALILSGAPQSVENFDQLKLSEEDRKSLLDFMSGTGLLLVAGPEGNGRRTFISFLLDKIAGGSGTAVWIGDGTEPAGSESVPRLKTDPLSGTDAGQILDALPEYRTIAVTLGTNVPLLPRLIALAETKKIILLINKPMKDAFDLCRNASPEFERVLKLAVRPWLLKELCSCAKPQQLSPDQLAAFRMIGSAKQTGFMSAGCVRCVSRGYTDIFVLYETGIPQRPTPSRAVLTALKLAESGKISIEDLNKVMKGE